MSYLQNNGVKVKEITSNLFSNVNFYLIGNVDPKAEKMLLDGGAHKFQYLSDILTHCIAESVDEEVVEAKELYQLIVVKSSWIRLSLQCNTLLPTKPFDVDAKNLLSGVTICPSQLSRHDNLLAWALVTVHGGKYTTSLNRTVTHLLTNISSGSKFVEASKVGLHVVCLQWLVVVIQEGKLITESDYHPDLFTCSSLATSDGEGCKKDVDTSNNSNNTTSRQLESSESNLGIVPHSMSLTQLDTNRLLSSASTEARNHPAPHKSLSSNSFIRKVPNKSCDWLPTTDHSHLPSIYRTHENPNDVKPENCLAGCCFFMEDCKKYLTDSEFNLWKQVIRQYQGKVMDDYADEVTHVLCETQDSPYFHKALTDKKRLVTSYWLNDCLSQRKLIVPCNCLHIPHMKPIEMICSNQTLCITNFDGYERVLVKRMIVMLGAKYTGFLNRNNSLLVAKRASGKKYQKALEWNVPIVNARWISELMFGNLKALKQPLLPRFTSFADDHPLALPTNITSHLLEGWKTAIKVPQEDSMLKDNICSYEWKMKKRKSDALNEDELSYKIRISDVNVVITGYSKDYSSYLSKETLKLGGQLVGMGVHCTHLVAPKILRTVKFLTCVSHASYVVTSQWLENSIAASQFLDPCSFLLKDEEVEQKLNFDFQKNIKHRSSGKLFQGLQVYMTPNISPPVPFLRELVKCHGGQVVTHPPDAAHPAPSLIIITCEKDVHLLADELKTNLYNSEFLINAIIKQQVDFSTFGGI